MIIFDLIISIFKCWFMFEFFYFNAAVHTKLLKIITKKSDKWYIHSSVVGNNFQMIIFDIINSFPNAGSGLDFDTSMLLFILSCLELFSNKLIYDIFMVAEAIIFRWLSLISLILFYNVVPGTNFSTLILLFILSGSKFLSNDVVILEIRNFYGSLIDISLITSVASDRNGVSELRVTSSSSIYFYYLMMLFYEIHQFFFLVVQRFDQIC